MKQKPKRKLRLAKLNYGLTAGLVVLGISIPGFLFGFSKLFVKAGSLTVSPPNISGCNIFPADNIWNTDISNAPLDPNSSTYINSIGPTVPIKANFGANYAGVINGAPYDVVPDSQPNVPIVFTVYPTQSDAGPYPIPANAQIQGGPDSTGDRHVSVLQSGTCMLYELYHAYPQTDGSWQADSGAVWNLNSDALRPAGWTSADAAGLPRLPGMVRYDEVAAGAINHALRFTVSQTQKKYVWPARHYASTSTNTALPPMGLRLRLKASVDISSFSATNQVILTALKKYGMMLADNGSSVFISGVPDDRWNNSDLAQLKLIPAADFEAVNVSGMMVSPDSGAVQQSISTPTPSPTPTVTPTPIPSIVSTNPTVAITSPANGSTVARNKRTTITATASSDYPIKKVAFFVNNNLVCSDTSSPYSCSWLVPNKINASYTILAKLTDSLNRTASNQITVKAK